MKILVTGAAGYLGSVLTGDLLAEGHAVTALDRFSRGKASLLDCCRHDSFKFAQGDVRDAVFMKPLLKEADAIIALAALVSPQSCVAKEELAYDINVSSVKLLNDLRSPSQPLLFMSTNIGYGTKERKAIYTEEDPLQPNSTYGSDESGGGKRSSPARRDSSSTAPPPPLAFRPACRTISCSITTSPRRSPPKPPGRL